MATVDNQRPQPTPSPSPLPAPTTPKQPINTEAIQQWADDAKSQVGQHLSNLATQLHVQQRHTQTYEFALSDLVFDSHGLRSSLPNHVELEHKSSAPKIDEAKINDWLRAGSINATPHEKTGTGSLYMQAGSNLASPNLDFDGIYVKSSIPFVLGMNTPPEVNMEVGLDGFSFATGVSPNGVRIIGATIQPGGVKTVVDGLQKWAGENMGIVALAALPVAAIGSVGTHAIASARGEAIPIPLNIPLISNDVTTLKAYSQLNMTGQQANPLSIVNAGMSWSQQFPNGHSLSLSGAYTFPHAKGIEPGIDARVSWSIPLMATPPQTP